MDQGKSMPITTFIAIGTLIGMFIVFQSLRDTGQEEASDAGVADVTAVQAQRPAAPPGATPAPRPRSKLWQEARPGVFCLNAGCTNMRVSAGTPSVCADEEACDPVTESQICVDHDCRSLSQVQTSIDFLPAVKRIQRRIGEQLRFDGDAPAQPVTLALSLDDAGFIHQVLTARSSGSNAFDHAAHQAVYEAAPFSEIKRALPHTRGLLQHIHLNVGTPR